MICILSPRLVLRRGTVLSVSYSQPVLCTVLVKVQRRHDAVQPRLSPIDWAEPVSPLFLRATLSSRRTALRDKVGILPKENVSNRETRSGLFFFSIVPPDNAPVLSRMSPVSRCQTQVMSVHYSSSSFFFFLTAWLKNSTKIRPKDTCRHCKRLPLSLPANHGDVSSSSTNEDSCDVIRPAGGHDTTAVAAAAASRPNSSTQLLPVAS